ncbi:MAG: DUF5678 domain-containing protein [archaeon]
MQHLELLNKFEEDMNFFNKNSKKLKEKYDEKFIAIKDNEIVAVGTIMEEVIKNLELKKIDPSGTFIQFISKTKIIL